MKPTIGRIVIYRSRTGDYDVPAIITATRDTLNRRGVEAGDVPDLISKDHVHLTVFTPGIPNLRRGDFKVVSEHPVGENVAGCYQEWDIAPWSAPEDGEQPAADWEPAPGSWRWPARV